MSNRFDWLEFPEEAPVEASGQAPPKTPQEDPQALLMQAGQAFLEGRYEVSLRHFSQALQLDRALSEAWSGQVRCLIRLGEYREAQAWAAKARGLFPAAPLILSAQAAALAASGLLLPALATSDEALEMAERLNLREPQIWLDRASCLLQDGQRSTAGYCLEKVRELRPEDPDWEQRIALELLEGQDLTGALEVLNRVVEHRPARAYAWFLLGRGSRKLGMRERARQALEEAERLQPGDPATQKELRALRRPCWIASLVFDSPEHPVVQTLRAWRDSRWLSWPGGRLAAEIYDRTAPGVCAVLVRFPRLQAGLRVCLQNLATRLQVRRSEWPGEETSR